jgi:membrane protease subunit (stomatin/prohibitin family)
MTTFIVENVSVPPEVEQAIDKRSSMAAVGNLNDYVKFQMAQGSRKATAVRAAWQPRWRSAWRWRSR